MYFRLVVFIFLTLSFAVIGNKNNRIIGGIKVKIGEYPSMIGIFEKAIELQFCGGSLVDLQNVVTAAHCFVTYTAAKVKVMGGDLDKNTKTSQFRQERTVSSVMVHPDFDNQAMYNDVCVLRLQSPVEKTTGLQPIQMVDKRPPVNARCVVVGWGRRNYSSYVENSKLLATSIVVGTYQACSKNWSTIVEKSMICAGVPDGKNDSCNGDSGGPLIYNSKLAGIVSYGYECGLPNILAIYTDVAYFRKWIDKMIKSNGISITRDYVLKSQK